MLAEFGVQVPRGKLVPPHAVAEAALALGFPVVIKASGAHLAHKTEVGGVVLNVRTEAEARNAAERLATLSDTLLVEQMFTDGVAVARDGAVRTIDLDRASYRAWAGGLRIDSDAQSNLKDFSHWGHLYG